MSMEEKILYRIHVIGRVQGVGFRYSAVREAKSRDSSTNANCPASPQFLK
jgi:acylphosphatase